jgi:hypothetical protein
MSEPTYSLALAFDSDDPEFVRGVEVGRLWEILKSRPDEQVTEVIHLSNAEMALRIGEALDRHVIADPSDDGWTAITYAPVDPERRNEAS